MAFSNLEGAISSAFMDLETSITKTKSIPSLFTSFFSVPPKS
ncbi:hypothetical protein [Apibacter sp. B3706]|nr:hypothetical protein [Apibacter sp. B3706]